jgi:homogentisate 1,2-dioxygenase
MIDRMQLGEVARKHHTQLRGPGGELRHEECFTRDGFDGPYSILYHLRRPHAHRLAPTTHGWAAPLAAPAELAGRPLAKRHYRSTELARPGGPQLDARVPLLFNKDLIAGVVSPTAPDPVYIADGDADELLYIHRGGGRLRSLLGDVVFAQGDYVYVPRGLLHRFEPDAAAGEQQWLWMSLTGGVHVPKQWRNDTGQLRMDAPYCHRDFKRPQLAAPYDEGIRELVVRRNGVWHGFAMADSPLDVVGWDGTVYPWAFPILAFQPRVSSVHLPPTWHGTFAAPGALICSFVPRPVDFAPDAIPCPYPHSSTHCDELIFYCDGSFTSRKGVGPGSISHHPMGVAHGPHPGAYEGSIGATHTSELAVMADVFEPLHATAAALGVEDAGYQDSFLSG